jgi:hypothetical protein
MYIVCMYDTLVINGTDTVVNLTATYVETKGYIYKHTYIYTNQHIHVQLIIATVNRTMDVVAPYSGATTITLTGTTSKLAAIHGADPRETPIILLGMYVCMYVLYDMYACMCEKPL